MPMARIERSFVVARYMSEIAAYPRHSHEQEKAVALRLQAGNREEPQSELIHANLSFVLSVARHYTYTGIPFEDLVSEGNLGLLEAARRFDPERGTRFITCAVWWIRRAIMRAVARRSAIVRLPRSQHRKVRRVLDASAHLSRQLGRAARRDEISADLGMPVAVIDEILTMRIREVSLDRPETPGDGRPLRRNLDDGGRGDPEAALARREARTLIAAALPRLSGRELLVIQARFGLTEGYERSLREVGELLGVSREAVRLIERQATAKLRRAILGRRHAGPKPRRAPHRITPLRAGSQAKPQRVAHSSQNGKPVVTSFGDIPLIVTNATDTGIERAAELTPDQERAVTGRLPDQEQVASTAG